MRPPTCVPEQHVGNRMWFGAKEPSVMRASMRRALIQITGGLEVAKKGELKSATWIRQRGQMGKRDPHGEIRKEMRGHTSGAWHGQDKARVGFAESATPHREKE
jgi:hypothetical protein